MALAAVLLAAVLLAAVQHFEIDQMDVVTAFLHPELDKEVYMEQPEGYTKSNIIVCRLKKALYGLKQAPRIWNIHVETFLKSLGFIPSTADSTLYIRHANLEPLPVMTLNNSS